MTANRRATFSMVTSPEARKAFDLSQEPVGSELRRQLGPEHLDRDGAAVLHIAREVDGGHAATAQLPLDRVAVFERSPEAGNCISHQRLLT